MGAPERLGADDLEILRSTPPRAPRIGIFGFLAGALYYHNIYDFDVGFDAVAPSPIVGAQRTRFHQKTVDWFGFLSVDAALKG